MPTKGQAPTPPSAQQLAQAQTGSNVSNALATSALNAVNQKTPQGSLTYTTDGYETITDPSTGQTYQIPKRTANVTYSPEQQALYDTGARTSQNLANVASDQSTRLGELLSKPFSLNNDAVEGRIMELASKRLNPELDRRRASLNNTLAQQGVALGSTAWDRAQESANQGENDALTQLLLNARGQAANELLTERSQPLNEIIGLATGGQIQAPQFGSTPQNSIAQTDYAGLMNNQYNQQYGAYQGQQAQSNDLLGGLFGLGKSLITLSDRRAKTDIKKIGETRDDQNLYQFRYKSGGPVQIGLMAQEVEKKRPGAVVKGPGGMKLVDYGKALAGAHKRAA